MLRNLPPLSYFEMAVNLYSISIVTVMMHSIELCRLVPYGWDFGGKIFWPIAESMTFGGVYFGS